MYEKIIADEADISSNEWSLKNSTIFILKDGVFSKNKVDNYYIESIYNYEKINSLFNNSDTMSFIKLLLDFEELVDNGYNRTFLSQSLHTMLSLPFFLFLMTALSAILTMHTLKKSENYKFIILGLVLSVLIYYFKDLSIALGKTDRTVSYTHLTLPTIE